LIFLRYPQFYTKFDVMMHYQKVKHACGVADRIVAVSEQTAMDVVEFLGADPAKITVIYQGCHRQFRETQSPEKIADIRLKYGLPRRYILMLGSIEARKNAVMLVKALALMPARSRPNLVIAGKATAYLREVKEVIQQLKLEDDIMFIHGADFADLPAIYQGAAAFVYPSLFEGFGIPIIEAMESGVPVATSTGSCFAEAGGPHALYADPHQPEAWAEAITTLLEKDQQQRITHQQEHVIKFRTEENLRALLNTYTF
jgi:glycosyltransferase involved in cell wall biosynthesis